MESTGPTYTLFAIPSLLALGAYQGELEGITFVAKSSHSTLRWFAMNCGQFDRIFAELLESGAATTLMNSLRRGLSVQLPGAYRPEQFETGFHPLPGQLEHPELELHGLAS